MSTTVKAGWLKDSQGNKFAPKTLSSQVVTSDGVTLESEIQSKLDTKSDTGHTHSWNNLQDKPFGETEPILTTIYEAENINPPLWEIPASLIEGKIYTVICDGTTYECVAKKDNYGSIYIGNPSVAGNSGNTGEPFHFSTYSDYGGALYITGDSAHSISISYYDSTIVELDSKYIPYVVGRKVENKTMVDNDGNEYVGGVGAEIFNNYNGNIASGEYSHAEGFNTISSNYSSHAEGSSTIASGYIAHAEGEGCEASGYESHAEGSWTKASGTVSHAEGCGTIASGDQSHAEGFNTIAAGNNQHVQGKYNIEDTDSTYAHIVGNGETEYAKSNAHTLDWDGNAWFAGDVYVGGTGQDDSDKLVTQSDLALSVMDLTSDQTANGVKTFSDGINIGNAMMTYDETNKRLVINVQ